MGKDNAKILLSLLKKRKRQNNEEIAFSDVPYFSMEDVRRVLREYENEQREREDRVKVQNKQKLIEKVLEENKDTVVSVAGIADILGFNPMQKAEPPKIDKRKIDPQYRKYYIKLLQLKDVVENKVPVPQELEFAWGLLKNESDKAKEIQDALDRIERKVYGICELTGENIAEERLEAVPYARYSVKGQQEFERQQALKKEKNEGPVFADDTEAMFEGEGYEGSE